MYDMRTREIQEAIDAADNALDHLERAKRMLSSASGWGLFDTLGGGFISGLIKHSKISTFSKPSFVVFDEILGGIADENYDQVKLLYDKIAKDYAFVLQITHLKAIADWHSTQIVIKKENNVSRIEVIK